MPTLLVRMPTWLLWASVFANPFVKLSESCDYNCLKKQDTKAEPGFTMLWWDMILWQLPRPQFPSGKAEWDNSLNMGYHGLWQRISFPSWATSDCTRNGHLTKTVTYRLDSLRENCHKILVKRYYQIQWCLENPTGPSFLVGSLKKKQHVKREELGH